MLYTIISGGQTGADRAALDWAIKHDVPHGGWCPKGRRAEDGVIPERYCLQETPRRNYQQRTKWNVRDSDATLIITLEAELMGGVKITHQHATKIGKPCLHIWPGTDWHKQIKALVDANAVRVLNVAGPRGSRALGIERFVDEVLNAL